MRATRSRAAIAAAAVLGVGVSLIGPATTAAATGEDRADRPVVEQESVEQESVEQERRAAAKPKRNQVLDKDSRAIRRAVDEKDIVAHLRRLEEIADRTGDRAAGRPGYAAGSRYIENQLKKAGYKPKRQYFDFTYTSVNKDDLTVDGEALEHIIMEGSVGTEGPVTGPLVAPTDPLGCTDAAWAGVDATDAVALVSRGTCSFAEKAAAAGAAGAAVVVIYNNAEGDLNGTLGGVTGLPPTTGITQAAGTALLAQLADGPVEATADFDVTVEERRTWNIITTTKRGDRDSTVMLGAHLDGVQDHAGINDNGTGSATLLQTAIALKKTGLEKKLRNNVRFAWWGAEEIGLLGSNHYVNELVTKRPKALDKIAVYLNYDMVGSPNYVISAYDADQSTYEAEAPVPAGSARTELAFRRYFKATKQPVVDTPFSGRSDYQAFILNGVPAGGLFTGADGVKTEREQQLFGGRAGVIYDPNYHTEKDTLANVNRKALRIMSDAIAHTTLKFGKNLNGIKQVRGGPKKLAKPALREGVVRR